MIRSAARLARERVSTVRRGRLIQAEAHRSRLFKALTLGGGAALGLAAALSLDRVPVTDRLRLLPVPPGMTEAFADAAFQQMVDDAPAATRADIQRVQRVAQAIVDAVDASTGVPAASFEWKVAVVDADDTVNAVCFPGGKIVVFSGLLRHVDRAAQEGRIDSADDALAGVLGHEVAHALAQHTRERLGTSFVLQALLASVIDSGLLNKAVEVALELPHSRLHEREADRIGLEIMTRACFHPSDAVKFHESIAADSIELLSTHPSSASRSEAARAFIADPDTLMRRMSHCADKGRWKGWKPWWW